MSKDLPEVGDFQIVDGIKFTAGPAPFFGDDIAVKWDGGVLGGAVIEQRTRDTDHPFRAEGVHHRTFFRAAEYSIRRQRMNFDAAKLTVAKFQAAVDVWFSDTVAEAMGTTS